MSKISDLIEDLEMASDGSGASHAIIDDTVKFLKTIPEWMTLAEFEKSEFEGICWILTNDGEIFARNYDGEYFINPYMPNYPMHTDHIRNVMPIVTPEAPK